MNHFPMHRRSLLLSLFLLAASTALHAQTSTEAMTIYVPFPAGGSSDVFARTLAPTLSKQLQRTLIVENLAGASGSIAARFYGAESQRFESAVKQANIELN